MNDSNHVKPAPMAYDGDRPTADNPVGVMDLSLRDGQQSLFGGRGRTEDMISIAEKIDDVGFWAVEMWGGSTFDTAHRLLNEDPWDRIRSLKPCFRKTPMAMALRAQSLVGYRHYPDDVARAFVERAAANGIDIFRTFDALNDFRNFEVVFDAVKNADKHFQACICFSLTEPRMGGPVYTLEYYAEKARELASMGADSICIKDLSGLLAPYDSYALVKGIKDAVKMPVHLHSHFTSGMAPMTHLKAIEAGVDGIDTCLSAYAYRTSHPAAAPLAMALLGTNRDTGLDMAKLAEIEETLEAEILPKYRSFLDESMVSAVPPAVLSRQLPPGMIDHIESKLAQMDASDKADRVYQLLPEVRSDLGQVPLVTPIYQIVATQAINNAVYDDGDGSYKIIADQTKDLCAGRYGRTPAPVNPDLKKKALQEYGKEDAGLEERPGKSLAFELEKAAKETEGLADGLEDEILYALFPVSGKQFLKWKHGREDPPSSTIPKSLEDARNELALIDRIKSGQPVELAGQEIPEKSDNLRTFNVFVEDEYFEVGVEEIGGLPEVSYIRPGGESERIRPETPKAAPVPKPAPASPSVPAPVPSGPKAPAPSASAAAADGVALVAPMPGTIVNYAKQTGDSVSEGETVLILEAMKMENALPAPATGVIKSIDFKNGDSVAKGDILCVIG